MLAHARGALGKRRVRSKYGDLRRYTLFDTKMPTLLKGIFKIV